MLLLLLLIVESNHSPCSDPGVDSPWVYNLHRRVGSLQHSNSRGVHAWFSQPHIHRYMFRDPLTGIHTNTYEGLWYHVKKSVLGTRDLELVLIDSVSVYCQCLRTVIMQSYDLVTSVVTTVREQVFANRSGYLDTAINSFNAPIRY